MVSKSGTPLPISIHGIRVDFRANGDIVQGDGSFVELSTGKMDPNTSQSEINGSVLSAKELLELHEVVLKRVREMTPKEGFQSLIASGIYTPEGKLAKEYGG